MPVAIIGIRSGHAGRRDTEPRIGQRNDGGGGNSPFCFAVKCLAEGSSSTWTRTNRIWPRDFPVAQTNADTRFILTQRFGQARDVPRGFRKAYLRFPVANACEQAGHLTTPTTPGYCENR